MAKVDMKVVLLGREYCGKTSLVERFLNERFVGENKYQNTIGAAYGARTLRVGDRDLVLGIWDTAGSERYESMSRMYYRGSKAAIVCYSVNDAESWERLQFWVSELRKMEEGCRVYICATKTDLLRGDNRNRVVDYHTTTDYCDEFGTELFETSSRQGTNISEMFLKVASDYLENEDVTDFVAHEEFTLNKSEKKSCCGGRS
eukprot:GFUD01042712.1.p1 GENE.GFUD01042712.1~~GFUD01042712.1.p1  ORF type:complete len:202 (+),score=42.89 GFUD01042712.1:177-782(+)